MPPSSDDGATQGLGTTAQSNAIDQGQALSIKEAWAKAIEDVGEVSPEELAAEEAALGGQANVPAVKAAKPKTQTDDERRENAPGVRDLVAERRRLRAKFETESSALKQSYAQREAQLQAAVAKYQPLHRAAEAIDAGDFDGIAQALAEFSGNDAIKDWNTLVNEAMRATQSPMYKEVRKLRSERETERRTQAQQAQQAQAQQAQQARAAQEKQWIGALSDEIVAEEDPAFAALLDTDPKFPDFVFATQKQHHEREGEILPTRAAAKETLRTLLQEVRKWQDYIVEHGDSALLKEVLGTQAPAKKPVNGSANRNGASGSANRNGVRQGAGKPNPTVSQNRTAEASATGRLSDQELKRRYARAMEEAAKTDPLWTGVQDN